MPILVIVSCALVVVCYFIQILHLVDICKDGETVSKREIIGWLIPLGSFFIFATVLLAKFKNSEW